ncbi:AMP-binding protein, partial [Streptomyces endophyticus]
MGGPHTLAHLADWAADAHGDAEALTFRDTTWTFRTLRDQVDQAARALMAQGLRPGESVGIWASNSDRWAIAALGTLTAGGVLVPVNTRYRATEAADILHRARARILLTEHDFLGRDYRTELTHGHQPPALQRIVALHDDAEWTTFLASGDAITTHQRHQRAAAVTPDAPSDLLFTSGTTGRPKGVIGQHGQVVRASRDWARTVTLQSGDRYLLVNPFFHTFGYKAGFVACLLTGATVLPEPVFDAARILQRIERDRVSVLTGAPTVFLSLLNHPQRPAHDLSTLRMAGTGASNIPTSLIEQIRTLGAHT